MKPEKKEPKKSNQNPKYEPSDPKSEPNDATNMSVEVQNEQVATQTKSETGRWELHAFVDVWLFAIGCALSQGSIYMAHFLPRISPDLRLRSHHC
jgi:hypothetical protein